jgi:2-hydroxycyclohexanecarboxyl-CoA dehydrogenase
MDLRLQGHVAVIVGGASGIGRATAERFLEENCHVVLWDSDSHVADQAAQLTSQRLSETATATGVQADIADEAAVQAAVVETLRHCGQINHLVHAAAIGSGHFGFPFTKVPTSAWEPVLRVNLMGMVHVATAVGSHLRDQGTGTMVFLSSVAGQIGSQTDPPYSASKAANINFAQCLAKDLAPHGVRVNTVCPGMVKTPLNHSVWAAWAAQQSPETWQSYEDWGGAKVKAVVPWGRWQTPADIADCVVFLSSERAGHIVGQTINVDGGFVMHW